MVWLHVTIFFNRISHFSHRLTNLSLFLAAANTQHHGNARRRRLHVRRRRAAKIQRSQYHREKKSNEMELVMGFYTKCCLSSCSLRSRNVWGANIRGRQTKRWFAWFGLRVQTFVRWNPPPTRRWLRWKNLRRYQGGMVPFARTRKSIQPKAKLIRKMISKGVFNKNLCGPFLKWNTHANKPPTSSRSSKMDEGLSTWTRSKTKSPPTFKERLPQSEQRSIYIIVYMYVIAMLSLSMIALPIGKAKAFQPCKCRGLKGPDLAIVFQ